MNKTIDKEENLAKIIHDLKTPINAQIKALESFLSTAEKKISQEEIDLIKLTINSCNYMHKLIETFNLVNKLNYKSLNLNYEKFDITKLIRNSIKEINILLKYQELDIAFSQTNEVIVNADKLQIKRVVDNLLSNSLNYSFKNSTIEISLEENVKNITFKVKNRSQYIDSKSIKEIFEKYKTQNSIYCKGGVGLGLFLSNEIIKAHFGQMFAKSSEDNVNIFGFTIPKD